MDKFVIADGDVELVNDFCVLRQNVDCADAGLKYGPGVTDNGSGH